MVNRATFREGEGGKEGEGESETRGREIMRQSPLAGKGLSDVFLLPVIPYCSASFLWERVATPCKDCLIFRTLLWCALPPVFSPCWLESANFPTRRTTLSWCVWKDPVAVDVFRGYFRKDDESAATNVQDVHIQCMFSLTYAFTSVHFAIIFS